MKTYLFDFDGTLVDSMPTFVSTIFKILDEYNLVYDKDIVKIVTPLGYKGSAEYFKKLGINISIDEIIQKMQDYMKTEYENNIGAKLNVKEALISLKEQGCDLNVLTASPHSVLDVCLKRLGIYNLFSNVWSCEDFNLTKADVEIYQLVAKQLKQKINDVIFLDDNFNSLKTAKTAGMRVFGVYDFSSEEHKDEIKRLVEKYIEDFAQLI